MILDVTPPVTPSDSGSQPELQPVEDVVPPLQLAEHEAQPVAMLTWYQQLHSGHQADVWIAPISGVRIVQV